MSHENVEIVRRRYEFWSGGLGRMVEVIDPDAGAHGTIGGLEVGDISRGVNKIRSASRLRTSKYGKSTASSR